jgi:hypothetical protein
LILLSAALEKYEGLRRDLSIRTTAVLDSIPLGETPQSGLMKGCEVNGMHQNGSFFELK